MAQRTGRPLGRGAPAPSPDGGACLIAIVGPTGVGKTEIAIALAHEFGAEIVSADSRQVYRGLDIGSAKPTPAQRAEVPHFVVDVADADEQFDCARFRDEALAAIADIRGRGRRVLLVGGTGLYVKVLRYGLFPGPRRDEALRAELQRREKEQPGWLHARLREIDPSAAERLHRRDIVRLTRAVEVHDLTGRPISAWQAEHGFRRPRLEVREIGLDLPRPELYRRIEDRCRQMVDTGLVEEIRRLYGDGLDPALPPLQSPGYREIGEHVRDLCDLAGAIERMARATRHLAKRQMTWFRADPAVDWQPPEVEVVCRRVTEIWG